MLMLYLNLFTLLIFGMCLGSFAGASVWRLRARQLKEDKHIGERVDNKEYKRLQKLTTRKLSNDRSECLSCSYKLKWYDLVPLLSWLSLAGRCRKCRKPIGYMEPLIELGVAAFFITSYIFWPYPLEGALEISKFIIWLVAGVGLSILFAYDYKWFLLPDKINFTVIGLGLLNSGIVVALSSNKISAILSILGATMVLSGFYWFIYIISKGMWIGFGDIKLGLGLALMLADWKLAFIALFAANLVGCIIVLPSMIMGKLDRKSHIPFGPLLIIGFFISAMAGTYLIKSLML